jgi:hypothetical protein
MKLIVQYNILFYRKCSAKEQNNITCLSGVDPEPYFYLNMYKNIFPQLGSLAGFLLLIFQLVILLRRQPRFRLILWVSLLCLAIHPSAPGSRLIWQLINDIWLQSIPTRRQDFSLTHRNIFQVLLTIFFGLML